MKDHTFSEAPEIISACLASKFGWEKQMVDAVCDEIMEAIATNFGGRAMYIPKRNHHFRNRIIEEFNGRNMQELADKYRLSLSAVRKMLAKNRKNRDSAKPAMIISFKDDTFRSEDKARSA